MSIADASQQRDAANARWRGQVVAKAVETLRSRAGELSDSQRADLLTIAAERHDDMEAGK